MGQVITQIHHFTSKLRGDLGRAKNRRRLKLSKNVVEDITLMLVFPEEAHKGTDINILVHRKPDKICRSDFCPVCLGGYSSDSFAWRFYSPKHLIFGASNNLFEHLATVITPWIYIPETIFQPHAIRIVGEVLVRSTAQATTQIKSKDV